MRYLLYDYIHLASAILVWIFEEEAEFYLFSIQDKPV